MSARDAKVRELLGRLQRWLEIRRQAVERCRQLAAEIREAEGRQ